MWMVQSAAASPRAQKVAPQLAAGSFEDRDVAGEAGDVQVSTIAK